MTIFEIVNQIADGPMWLKAFAFVTVAFATGIVTAMLRDLTGRGS